MDLRAVATCVVTRENTLGTQGPTLAEPTKTRWCAVQILPHPVILSEKIEQATQVLDGTSRTSCIAWHPSLHFCKTN